LAELRRPEPRVPTLPFGRQTTVAVVASEFFDTRISRMGGFGYSTRMVGNVFRRYPEVGVHLVYVMACGGDRFDGMRNQRGVVYAHGWPLINLCTFPPGVTSGPDSLTNTDFARAYLREQKVSFFLFIDFRTNYEPAHTMLPDVPILLWARDPRTNAQRRKIEHIVIPGERLQAQGTRTPNARRARRLWNSAHWRGDDRGADDENPRTRGVQPALQRHHQGVAQHH